MMRYLDLPPRLAYEVEQAAEKAGVSPEELATVLLNVAVALYGQRPKWPFAATVRDDLEARSAARVPALFAELVRRCLDSAPADRGAGAAEAGAGLGAWYEAYNPVPYETRPGEGTLMVKEQPMYSYGQPAPVPGPLARASALGRYAHLRSGSEEFARAKEAEITREDRVRR